MIVTEGESMDHLNNLEFSMLPQINLGEIKCVIKWNLTWKNQRERLWPCLLFYLIIYFGYIKKLFILGVEEFLSNLSPKCVCVRALHRSVSRGFRLVWHTVHIIVEINHQGIKINLRVWPFLINFLPYIWSRIEPWYHI